MHKSYSSTTSVSIALRGASGSLLLSSKYYSLSNRWGSGVF